MKLLLWSIGKEHEPYVKTGIDDFTKRLGRYYPVEWSILPPPRSVSDPAVAKKKEAGTVLTQLSREDFLTVLDERGKQFSSDDLARFLQNRANNSSRNVVFLIGGAYGVDDSLLARADHRWSLSQLTFPHQLVRLILAESLYRACTILRNEKYHHG